jgi:methylmalonyl-CoA mutase N-terminal domain/subunit
MHLFDGADLHETQTSFYISAVLIAVVTYLLSGLAVWWVGDLEREQEMRDRWQLWKTKISNRKHKFNGTTTTDHEKTEAARSSVRESRYSSLRELLRPRRKNGAEP